MSSALLSASRARPPSSGRCPAAVEKASSPQMASAQRSASSTRSSSDGARGRAGLLACACAELGRLSSTRISRVATSAKDANVWREANASTAAQSWPNDGRSMASLTPAGTEATCSCGPLRLRRNICRSTRRRPEGIGEWPEEQDLGSARTSCTAGCTSSSSLESSHSSAAFPDDSRTYWIISGISRLGVRAARMGDCDSSLAPSL
mmetsp:Transcript_4482/g.11832  ORF Transcript_4482/g.11832 Transcript_4482/m.11832 type:complete len:206 (-) Transcript_4482:123-740(-)